MKINYLKLIAVMAFGSFIFSSCNDSDTEIAPEQISTNDVIEVLSVEDISEDAESVVEDYLTFEEGIAFKSENEIASKGPKFLDCRVKTIVIENKTKTVTIDFGDGCEMPNGNILKGKIVIVHKIDMTDPTIMITTKYVDFYVNDLKIEGGNSMVKTKSNDNGNPQSSITFEKKVIWPDGEFKLKKGVKVKEWIEGFDTREWSDNVFLITGAWSTIFKDGNEFAARVIEPLRREAACRFIVSGELGIKKNDRIGTINFGDGTCDDKAIFTNQAGEETEITLRPNGKKD